MGGRPRNLLFVVLDTVRADHLTPYGYDRETTPALGRFAADATVFENAVAPAPWTLPVHASLFTGRHPSGHGANQETPYLADAGGRTLAAALSAAGYETACYTANAWITPYTRLTAGFDRHDNFFQVLPRDLLSGPLAAAWRRLNDSPRLRGAANALVALGNVAHEYLASSDDAASKTPRVVDRTKAFIEAADPAGSADPSDPSDPSGPDDPGWFAFLNLMDAHLPYHPPDEHAERFAPGVDSSAVCQNSKAYNCGARAVDDEEWAAIRGLYDAEIAQMDAELGRLLDWLDATGRRADTAVIVCADHGELHGEHDLYGHEFGLYDPLVSVPLLIDHPGLSAGRRTDTVELLDLYHTVLDALGVDPTAVLGGDGTGDEGGAAGGGDGSGDTAPVPLDRTRSLLAEEYRDFQRVPESERDPGQRAALDRRAAGDDARYAFVEYARPVVELHQLERKAAAAGIDLDPDSRFHARSRAARAADAKYVRRDRVPDQSFRLDADPGETDDRGPGPADDRLAATERALAAFEAAAGGAWTAADADADAAGRGADAVAEMDADARERLRELGYLE